MAILFGLFIIGFIMLFSTIANLNKKKLEQLKINIQIAEDDYFMYLKSEQAKSENFLYKDYLLEKITSAKRELELYYVQQSIHS
jgi:hypothetical protein